MASTYEPIATTTLGSATNTFTFSGISSAYTDLRLIARITGATATSDAGLKLNNDASTIYYQTTFRGNGAVAVTDSVATNSSFYANLSADLGNNYAVITFDFLSYANSTYKTCLSTFNSDRNGSGYVVQLGNLYRSTNAINRIDLFLFNAAHTFNVGSSVTLYGILRA